jgi:hypothetical protein
MINASTGATEPSVRLAPLDSFDLHRRIYRVEKERFDKTWTKLVGVPAIPSPGMFRLKLKNCRPGEGTASYRGLPDLPWEPRELIAVQFCSQNLPIADAAHRTRFGRAAYQTQKPLRPSE